MNLKDVIIKDPTNVILLTFVRTLKVNLIISLLYSIFKFYFCSDVVNTWTICRRWRWYLKID